jgi:hypothetical protein
VLVPRSGSTLNAKRQSHAVRQQLSAQGDGVEQQLQRKAERHAYQHLLYGDDDAGGGEGRDAARRCHERRDQERHDRGKTDAQARRHECAPNAGATMKHAPMRMKGQKISAIHPSSCPLVSVIMVS